MANSFTPDDIRILEKTLSIRERMLDNLISKQDLPTKARDIDAYVNLAESMDRSVFSKAKIKVDEASNKIDEESKALLTNLLLDLHKGVKPEGFDLGEEAVPDFTPRPDSNVSDGELIRKRDEVGMEILEDIE